MADDIAQRITALSPLPVVAAEDVFVIVDDPDGVGKKTKKAVLSDVNNEFTRTMTGFIQSAIGTLTPVERTVQAKGRELITSADFTSTPPIGLTGVGTGVLAAITTGAINTAFGESALAANTSGFGNTAIGFQALKDNTTGGSPTFGGNTALGSAAATKNLTGHNNTAIGLDALFTNTAGDSNTAVGSNALGFGTSGSLNVAVGWRSLFNGGAGSRNVAVGVKSLNDNLTGTGNVAIGYFAGAYELGANAFYVDNQDRVNTTGDKAGALLFGTFNSTPSSQTLTVNGSLTCTQTLTGGQFTAKFGVKAGTNQIGNFTTTDGAGSTAMQLNITNNTNVSMQLQSIEQGTSVRPIDLNPGGGDVVIGSSSGDAKFGKALIALGGGAAPTLGTIGGAGPATAGQNTWLRLLDSTGAAFWVPAWK